MTTIIAGTAFERTIDYATLPKAKLLKLYHSAIAAYNDFFQLWQGAVRDHFDAGTADVWLKYGGAEDDLRYGLIAAGAETGNVETLLRGF